jgi:hypothetical protein
MITAAHVLLYSSNADADRKFFQDVLDFRSADAGGGWLIFALPPSELAVHPSGGDDSQTHAGHAMLGAVLYLMCDNLQQQVAEFKDKGVSCTEVQRENWGIRTTITLPSGGELGLYQPTHASPLNL